MSKPLISVIMAVYNHQAYLRQAAGSVLDQTFRDWELILIDDGSTDRSAEFIDDIARSDPRVVPIHQRNVGLAKSRNRGISLARGTWIAYLDSDDLWFPHALQTYDEYLRSRPEAQFLFGHAHRLRGDQITELRNQHHDRPIGTRELFQRVFLVPLAVCHRRDLWAKAGRFDATLRWCDDYDLFLRMSLYCRLEPVGRALGLRRRHGGNMSARRGQTQQAEADVLQRFVKQHCRPLLGDPIIVRRLSQVYARAARCYFRERNFTQALAMAQQAHAFSPSLRNRALAWLSRWLVPSGTMPKRAG
jgi:glycosyltransferase involved in cell wall biosynthesis